MFRYVFVLLLIAMVVVAATAAKHTTPKPRKKCPQYEKWSRCGTSCEVTCAIWDDGFTVCPKFECQKHLVACRCKPGYVRNNKKCIPPQKCPNWKDPRS